MASPYLKLALLFATGLSCASVLEPWHQNWEGGRSQSANVLDMLVGDSRRLFANHFFAKADAYFHSGYYPTIFDAKAPEEKSHLAGEEEATHHGDDEEEAEGGFLGAPKDWIDRFGRNFFPAHHSHLEKGGERELLPWLRMSAQVDPQMVDTYTIASYWLRRRLGKVDEAEQFLREGLQANPNSYEIYFELGRIYDENRHDPKMARSLWEIALSKWNAQPEKPLVEQNLIHEAIVGRLAHLEEDQGNLRQAIDYMKLLETNLENILAQEDLEPIYKKGTEERLKQIQKQIQELQTKDSTRPQ